MMNLVYFFIVLLHTHVDYTFALKQHTSVPTDSPSERPSARGSETPSTTPTDCYEYYNDPYAMFRPESYPYNCTKVFINSTAPSIAPQETFFPTMEFFSEAEETFTQMYEGLDLVGKYYQIKMSMAGVRQWGNSIHDGIIR